jgi:ribosomal protein S14
MDAEKEFETTLNNLDIDEVYYIKGYNICHRCKKPFTYFRKKKYCSTNCREKANRKKHRIYQNTYYKKWKAQNKDYRKLQSEMAKEWRLENPEKVKAVTKVRAAINKGDIIKPLICEMCGRKTRLNGHHPNYNKPLQVKWVCNSCHSLLHIRKNKLKNLKKEALP